MQTKTLKIVIADDHELIRTGMIHVLQKNPEFEIVGTASDGESLFELLKNTPCDLLCLDVNMPNFNFFSAVSIFNKIKASMKILVITGLDDNYILRKAFQEDVDGILLKSESTELLSNAIKSIISGKRFFSQNVQDLMNNLNSGSSSKLIAKLTDREKEVVSLVAQGLKNKDIAKKLKIKEVTVDFHKKNIKKKMKIHSNAEMTKIALENSLI